MLELNTRCSIKIQKSTKDVNDLNLRIGVHQGDIIIEDNDVFGDDINIAKEIESNAPHGGIAISETVNDLIWDSKDIYIREYSKINSGFHLYRSTSR